MELSVLYFDDCPSYQIALEDLRLITAEMGWEGSIDLIRVGSHTDAERLGFRGSPTVLVNGHDPFVDSRTPIGLACRLYRTETGYRGSPSPAMLRQAITDT